MPDEKEDNSEDTQEETTYYDKDGEETGTSVTTEEPEEKDPISAIIEA